MPADVIPFPESATARDSRRREVCMHTVKSAAVIAAGFVVVLILDSVSGGMISKSPLRGLIGG